MQIKDISSLYMTDLIQSMQTDIWKYYHYEGELVKKFQHAHMSVRPDENRITLEDLKELVSALISGKNEETSGFAFNILEAAITSIIRNGDYGGQLILSEVPDFPLNVIFILFAPINEICSEEPSYWVKGYEESLFWAIVNYKIQTERPENLITTLKECFSLNILLSHVNDTVYLRKRWMDALERNHVGACVSYPDVLLAAHIIWDLYSNRESRRLFFTDRIFIEVNRVQETKSIRDFIAFIEKKIPNAEYYITNFECGIIDLIRNDNPDILKDSMEEFCTDKMSNNSNSFDCILELINAAFGNVKITTHMSSGKGGGYYEMIHEKILDIWDQVRHQFVDTHTEPSSVFLDRGLIWANNQLCKDQEDPMTSLKDIPAFFSDSTEESDSSSEVSGAMEAFHKDSPKMNAAGKKIYKAFRTYKSAEEKVDSQLTKAAKAAGKMVIGDTRKEVIEGKHYTVLGVLKRAMGTVALFSTGKIKAIIALVVRHALRKKSTESEKRKVIMELQTEIDMITEKIEDARGDNNREAKYAMMRTKKDLENALKRVQYGMEADTKTIQGAKNALNNAR